MAVAGIVKEKVELNVSDGTTMWAYLARPASGGPHPGLMVFQEAFGVNGHIRDRDREVRRPGDTWRSRPNYFTAQRGRDSRVVMRTSRQSCRTCGP